MRRNQRTTIADVAAAANVSTSTASRALSGRGYVASQVRARVLAAAQRINYVPDAAARSLRSGTSREIGVMVTDLRDPYYAELASGIERRLRGAGYHMVLVSDGGDAIEGLAAVQTFAAMRVPGVILTPDSPKVVEELTRHGIHVVQADRLIPGIAADSVVGANEQGALLATTHLLEHGHRRIAMVIDEAVWTTGSGRLAGFRRAHRDFDLTLDDDLVVFSAATPSDAGRTVGQLLDNHPDVTALVAVNNVIAQGALSELQRRGTPMPQRISLVAYDDVPWMSLVRPAITTVDQHAEEIGRCSADLLVNRLAARLGGQAVSILVEPHLVVRGSVATLRRARQRTRRAPIPARGHGHGSTSTG